MPDTGGSNIPALNEFLQEFGIALRDKVLEGYFLMGEHSMYYASGTSLLRFPQGNGSIIIERDLHDQGQEVNKHISIAFCFCKFKTFIFCTLASHR